MASQQLKGFRALYDLMVQKGKWQRGDMISLHSTAQSEFYQKKEDWIAGRGVDVETVNSLEKLAENAKNRAIEKLSQEILACF